LPNNRLHTDRKKLRSFLASHFASGEAERSVRGNKMGKKARTKRERSVRKKLLADGFWEDANGIHASFSVPGEPPPDAAEKMTEMFQKNIRKSPLWKDMVDHFGEEEAERLLKGFKAEIK